MPTGQPTLRYRPDEDEDLSTAIITAISEAKGRDVSEDECVLYDTIDTDALDMLFHRKSDDDTIKIEFATHEAIVIIWGNGKITIEVQDLGGGPHYR